jgi:hypothetical protein
MVIRRTPNGNEYREPPHTEAEEADFLPPRGGGPVIVVKPAPAAAPQRKSSPPLSTKE